jgi:GntR family transcriptional regulator
VPVVHIQISLTDGVPIYRQIVNQIKYAVASGKIRPDEELPPIRVLAEQITVTPNTVVKAYGELEAEGVIYKRRGAGTYVADLRPPLARKEQRRILTERIDGLLAEASQLNFSIDEVHQIIRKRHAAMTRLFSDSSARRKNDVG